MASLPPLSPAATTTSPVGREGDGLLGDAGLELGEAALGLLGDRGDLLGPGGALGLEVGLGPGELGVELVLGLVHLGAQLVLELGQRLAGLAAATLGLFLELAARARLRASSSTWVTMYRAK